jgi:carbonic anhydrase
MDAAFFCHSADQRSLWRPDGYHFSMPVIVPVHPTPQTPRLDQARELFRLYYQFLRETKSCGTHLPRLDDEIATLPTAYTSRDGEVLLALVDDEPAACIASRAVESDPSSCDIKRLFVHPGFRGHGLARLLVLDVLARATARNFTRAILDTDTTTMRAAHALYLALGFREYADLDNLTYLELPLGKPF